MNDLKNTLISASVAAGITLLGTLTAAGLGYFNKDRELDIQMVHVGLSILRGEATTDDEKTSEQARRFALNLLNEYSGVNIENEDFEAWLKSGTTPFAEVAAFSRGAISATDNNWVVPLFSPPSSAPRPNLQADLINGTTYRVRAAGMPTVDRRSANRIMVSISAMGCFDFKASDPERKRLLDEMTTGTPFLDFEITFAAQLDAININECINTIFYEFNKVAEQNHVTGTTGRK